MFQSKYGLDRDEETKTFKIRTERKYELPKISETKATSVLKLEDSGKAFEKLINFSKNINTQFQ